MSDLTTSIVHITSLNPKNKGFGTGFIIHKDKQNTYILTCAHVIEEVGGSLTDPLEVEKVKSEVIKIGASNSLDLALIKIGRLLEGSPLKLSQCGKTDMPFHSKGWVKYIKKQSKVDNFQGKLGSFTQFSGVEEEERINAWNIELEGEKSRNKLEHGCSGAPVIDDDSKSVVGIITSMDLETGKEGEAIDIKELLNLWDDIPEDLKTGLQSEEQTANLQIDESENLGDDISQYRDSEVYALKEKEDREKEITELKKQLAQLSEQPVSPTPAAQPGPSEHEPNREKQLLVTKRDTLLINCEDQVRIYRKMLRREVSERVLLIKGEAKMGKSHLLRVFRRIVLQDQQCYCALVDIRTRGQSYREILKLIVLEVGYNYFRRYEEKARQLPSGSMTPVVSQDNMAAPTMALFQAIQNQSSQSAEDHQYQLTQAFVDDLRLMPTTSLVVLLLDAFEEANEETRQWIYQVLLIGLYKLPNILTVFAGRELPDPEITWKDVAIATKLDAVTEDDYKAYRNDIGATGLEEEQIPILHRGFNGRPGNFAEFVENFVPKGA